jgi:phenylacetate-CoA ligase
VIGPDGSPVPSGTQGELVVTGLDLTSMPLIRYKMGDIAAAVAGPCECGRGLGLSTRVQGRTAHVIRGPDGVLITTPVITNLIGQAQAYEWVRRFQVREEPDRRLRVLLEARQSPSEAERHTLIRMLESGVGPDFQVALEIVDQIPVAPSGKRQLLVPLARG